MIQKNKEQAYLEEVEGYNVVVIGVHCLEGFCRDKKGNSIGNAKKLFVQNNDNSSKKNITKQNGNLSGKIYGL